MLICSSIPQVWNQDDASRYTKGCILSIVSLAGLIVGLVVYLFTVIAINKKRDSMGEQGYSEYVGGIVNGGMHIRLSVESDLADEQDKSFRYTIHVVYNALPTLRYGAIPTRPIGSSGSCQVSQYFESSHGN